MNQNDINAARKLIAQFHGKALGRHNSNMFNRETERQYPTQVPGTWSVEPKIGPNDCSLGDYCWSMQREIPEGCMIVRLAKPFKPEPLWNGEFRMPSICEQSYFEFERVWLIHRGMRREAWRRIA